VARSGLLLAFLLLNSGCGTSGESASARPAVPNSAGPGNHLFSSKSTAVESGDSSSPVVTSDGMISQTPDKMEPLNRKIIYNSSIGLVVEDYREFESNFPGLVAQHGGFVANNKTDRQYNDSQHGMWVVRVPVSQYSDFLAGIDGLGFAESRHENAQDVTEEYVDVEARIKNKKVLETRIVKMLEERSGKLTDVLQIERELSRVREEIERMEGRIRYLADQTSLATVTVNCREEKEYVPAAAPTLVSRMTHSWSGSLATMRHVFEEILITLIAMIPWLVLFSGLLLVSVKLARLWWRPVVN